MESQELHTSMPGIVENDDYVVMPARMESIDPFLCYGCVECNSVALSVKK